MHAGPLARTGPARLSFGPFTIDADRAELTRDGHPVALRAKAFALLLYLADHAGKVVGKQELFDAVWPGVIVTDDSLAQVVSELRAALDDRSQAWIRTVPRRGYRLDAVMASTPSGPGTTRPARWRSRWVTAATVAVLSSIVAVGWIQLRAAAPPRSIGAALAESRSLVVMPFTDLSEPPAPHVALAVDNILTTDLGQLADVRVMARGSAASLGNSANADLRQIRKALNVRYVVTGSVKRDGERLHITMQLAETDSGALLWTGRFDYPSLGDWISRRDLSVRIANVLDTKMRDAAFVRAQRVPPVGAAVDHWMRGTFIMSNLKPAGRAELMQARSEFEAAVAAQPDSSDALAELARTYVSEVSFRWAVDRKAALAKAEPMVRRALAIDPDNRDGLLCLSLLLLLDGRIAEAMAVTRHTLELDPYDWGANQELAAAYFFAGRWEDSVRQIQLAMKLNPLDKEKIAMDESMIATALIPLGRYDEAIEHARRIMVGPRAGGAEMIASAEAWRGDMDAARAAAAEALRHNPTSTIARDRAMRGSREPAYLAGMDHYYEGLRRAGYPEGN